MEKGRFTGRLAREWNTIDKMMHLFCHEVHHASKGDLCPQCAELNAYAQERLVKCPYQQDKPTCANCPIHCYKPAKREQVRQMMRYAGPRMLLHHPLLAVLHLLDGRRKAPALRKPVKRSTEE